MAQSRNDREMPSLIGVHHLFGGIENGQIHIAIFATRLGNGLVVVLFWFGGANALSNLLHVPLLSFVRFRIVFCHIGGCESRKSGEIAVVNCQKYCVCSLFARVGFGKLFDKERVKL